MTRGRAAACTVCLVCALGASAQGRQRSDSRLPLANDVDPPRPVEPDTVSRGENGRVVVRAVRLSEPFKVDGRLDEALYRTARPIDGFVQGMPNTGQPASEKTEAWVAFDAENVYVTCKCYDSAPPEEWVANELRRDGVQLRNNDTFGVVLDTFHDRRNGYFFYSNALGGFSDQVITDEGNPNIEWNTVWQVRTGRFDGGWIVEMGIPFKSIRYNSGTDQTWGIQFRRMIRHKYEWVYLTPMPRAFGGQAGVMRVSRAATLVGLDLPDASTNMELKPYATSRVTTDLLSNPPIANDPRGEVGFDAKYGVTANLTADLTVNTDFAQVEVDEQQVNLTRFTLQLPEKRDFFLEGRGVFDFPRSPPAGGAPTGNASAATPGVNTGTTPQLFYSRRIGLNNGREVPLYVGGRLTGRVGNYSIGVINIEAGKETSSATPATNFTVVRVKRDILRRSSFGMIATHRSRSATAPSGGNTAYGADAAFNLFQNVSLGGYYSRTMTEGLEGDDDSYQARFDYAGDRYGVRTEYLKVGDHFNPEVGFVRRDNFRRSYGQLRFSPRPRRYGIRQLVSQLSLEYIEDGRGRLETRLLDGKVNFDLENSDQFTVEARSDYELLVRPFRLSGVTIPAGGYTFSDLTTSYTFGQQRRASGTLSLQVGSFYDGSITALGLSTGRVAILTQWSLEPSMSVNRVELPAGSFTTTVVRTRSDYGFSARMFLGGLVQYSSSDKVLSSNIRYRWEYRLGSELFVVYTDERDTLGSGRASLRNRAFVVKINRLMRF